VKNKNDVVYEITSDQAIQVLCTECSSKLALLAIYFCIQCGIFFVVFNSVKMLALNTGDLTY